MVGFIYEPNTSAIEELTHTPKLKISRDPFEHSEPKSNDFALVDSFLDFDSINNWIEGLADPVMAEAGRVEFGAEDNRNEVISERVSGEIIETDKVLEPHQILGSSGPKADEPEPIADVLKPVVDESDSVPMVECGKCDKSENMSCSIEEKMEKVTLVGGSILSSVFDIEKRVENELESHADESESSSEPESTSSSSSSSSCSSSNSSEEEDEDEVEDEDEDEEEEEENKDEINVKTKRDTNMVVEVEEGEIRDVDDDVDQNLAWNDVDNGDLEDDEDDAAKGRPIMSKNELQVLPPVPSVDVILQPHHHMVPVGIILSMIGVQVIVEGVEKHNPLNEGSILWITERGSPLGLVDEIFGPVKNPYYVVRYNSENEVPSGIHEGTLISFVPEFAEHVLNDKNLYKKGYDASGENDEEVSDESEFSDDEKEADYKRKQKMEKRGMNDQTNGNRKNNRKKKSDQPFKQTHNDQFQLPPDGNNHHNFSPVASLDHGGGGGRGSTSASAGQGFVNGVNFVSPLPPMAQTANGSTPNSNLMWMTRLPFQHQQIPMNGLPFQQQQGPMANFPFQQQQVPMAGLPFQPQQTPMAGLPFQQQQNPIFPNGFPLNGMPWIMQNPNQNSYQMQMLNTVPGFVGQHGFNNQTIIGMGFPSQPNLQPNILGNAGDQKTIYPGGSQVGQNPNVRPPVEVQGSTEGAQQFNTGMSSSHGRKPYGRGRGRGHNRGGRGWQQRN